MFRRSCSLFLSAVASRRSARRSSTRFLTASADHDVLIVGGGVVGASLARLLNERMSQLSVGILERQRGPASGGTFTRPTGSTDKRKSNSSGPESPRPPHPRAYALSPKSLKTLGSCVTSVVPKGMYTSMQVWEEQSPSLLVFSEKDIVDNSDSSDFGLGCVVEDEALVQALWNELEQSNNSTKLYRQAQLQDIKVDDHDGMVRVNVTHEGANKSLAASQTELSTRVLVAADGANSFVRTHLGIPFDGFDYPRTALTCTLRLNANAKMAPRAFQRFLPHGPMALLPTFDSNYATVVWSTTHEQAKFYKETAEEDLLVDMINRTLQQGPQRVPSLFGSDENAASNVFSNLAYGADKVLETLHYGLTMAHWSDYEESFVAPPAVQAVVGDKFTFPLQCRHVADYAYGNNNQIILVGDAAHTVHPMAGQGLNLGLGDVAALVDALDHAHSSGMALTTFLKSNYATPQHRVNRVAQQGIHALHEAFGNRTGYMMHSKSLGMHAANMIGPIRRQLAAVATGTM